MAEFQLVEAFIKKWGMDPVKAKMILAKVPPVRRRSILSGFKTSTPGPAAINALTQYIAQTEKSNPAGTAPANGGVRPVATAGIKRPLIAAAPSDPSKRPRFTPPKAAAASAPAVRPVYTPVRPGATKPLAQFRPATPGARPMATVGGRPLATAKAPVAGIRPGVTPPRAGQQTVGGRPTMRPRPPATAPPGIAPTAAKVMGPKPQGS